MLLVSSLKLCRHTRFFSGGVTHAASLISEAVPAYKIFQWGSRQMLVVPKIIFLIHPIDPPNCSNKSNEVVILEHDFYLSHFIC